MHNGGTGVTSHSETAAAKNSSQYHPLGDAYLILTAGAGRGNEWLCAAGVI